MATGVGVRLDIVNANIRQCMGQKVKRVRMENENEKMREAATGLKGNWPSIFVLLGFHPTTHDDLRLGAGRAVVDIAEHSAKLPASLAQRPRLTSFDLVLVPLPNSSLAYHMGEENTDELSS